MTKLLRKPARLRVYDNLGIIGMLFMGVVFIAPMLMIFSYSATKPGPENFLTAISDVTFQRALWETVTMSFWVTVACVVLGYPYAFAMARGGKGLMMFLLIALMLSFWTSTLVRTYAWQVLLNDTGVVNNLLRQTGLVDSPVRMIRTDFAVYLGMTHVLAPLAILPIYAQMRSISPDLEKAAQVMGARRATAFLRVTLPLSLPGAAAGAILVFVSALGFYITPQILGDSKKLYVGSAIIQQLQTFLDIGVGSAMAVILLAIVVVTLLVGAKLVGLEKVLGIADRKSS